MRGDPKTMQMPENTTYDNLIADVASELSVKVDRAVESGVMPWCIISDPGIGFAKTHDQNLQILNHLSELRQSFSSGFLTRAPMLVGPSRKGFLGSITNKTNPAERDVATSAALVIAAMQDCSIFRVHNVGVASDALKIADAVKAH